MTRIEWEFEGETYYVGEAINSQVRHKDSIYPIVFCRKKLYKVNQNKYNKLALQDLYKEQSKLYWIEANKVFEIIKDTNHRNN